MAAIPGFILKEKQSFLHPKKREKIPHERFMIRNYILTYYEQTMYNTSKK